MGACPLPSRIEKILAPELKTDDCFATDVKRQTLQLKHYKRATCSGHSKGKCAISSLIFQKFSGAPPSDPILGRGYGAPSQTPPLRAPALRPPAPRSGGGHSVPPSWCSPHKNHGYVPVYKHIKTFLFSAY